MRHYLEQLEAALASLRLVDECADALTEDGYAYLVDAAREGLGSNPAISPPLIPGPNGPLDQPQQPPATSPAKERQ